MSHSDKVLRDSIEPATTIALAKIARIELTPEEIEAFTEDISVVLDYMHELIEINTDDIAPLCSPFERSLVLREDIASIDPTRNAMPDHYFVVPCMQDDSQQ